MRNVVWALLFLTSSFASTSVAGSGRTVHVATADQLIAALAEPLDNVTVQLAPGDYVIPARMGSDRVKDCSGKSSTIRTTTGLKISGKRVRVVGPSEGQAMILTDAGYKIVFKNCRDCELERIKVMGPPREEEHSNSDALVVVMHSKVRIANCRLVTDIPPLSLPPTALPGGDGIRVREGADVLIEFNEITCFTWGIVLETGSRAVIKNNLLEGVAMKTRGAILVACDADARAERNLIRSFPRGVEVTGSPSFVMKANILEDVRDEGVLVQSTAAAGVVIEQNALYRCGSIGVDVKSGPGARISRNLIVDTAIIEGAPNGVRAPAGVTVRKNTAYNEGGAGSREMFWRARKKWTRTYRHTPVGVDGRHKFYESAFLTRYGRWAD